MTKNELIFSAITGFAVAGRDAGAENDGWRDRDSTEEAIGYHDAVMFDDLGDDIKAELDAADGEFDAEAVAEMLEAAKSE